MKIKKYAKKKFKEFQKSQKEKGEYRKELKQEATTIQRKAYKEEYLKQAKGKAKQLAKEKFNPQKKSNQPMNPILTNLMYGDTTPKKKKKGKSDLDKLLEM